MYYQFRPNSVIDVADYVDGSGVPRDFGKEFCRELHANADTTVSVSCVNQNIEQMVLKAGDESCVMASRVMNGVVSGAANTAIVIDATDTSAVTYAWVATGTDPVFTTSTIKVGMTIDIYSPNFSASNNGQFIVTAIVDKKFTIVNLSGVTETELIGTGGKIVICSPLVKGTVLAIF